MLIKREGKMFVVYQDCNEMFKSTDFDECVIWTNNNGGFNGARKKTYPIARKTQ